MSTQRPSTPDRARPSASRTSSYSVAPKSEILRNALHARRAQTSTPTPTERRIPAAESRTPQPTAPAPYASPDVFDEFELSEEQTRPVSPINRRRRSDVGVPRPKTTRQLNQENEQLRAALMDANMRVQLLKTNNSELQEDNTKLREKVEELEPVEQENEDLWHECNSLRSKMAEMEPEMEDLKDGHEELRKSNEELKKSNEELNALLNECTAHMDGLESAMQEAVDTILGLESEKAALETKKTVWEKENAALREDVQFMKERVSNLEYDKTLSDTLVDGTQRCPSRVYSIDEARPSTSHFDSDYFSQPDSPVVKPSRESVNSVAPSERSQKFLDLTQERRQSARDLAKRMSTASLKALRISAHAPAPEVPEIPAQFQQEMPRIVENTMPVRQYQKSSKRYRDRKLPDHIIQEALQISPEMPESPLSRSPLPQGGQLRAAYRSDQSLGTRSSSDSRPSSSHRQTPTSTRSRHRQPSAAQPSPRVPSRRSSKQAHTNSSSEHVAPHELRRTRQRRSDSDIGSAEAPQAEPSEWASMPPPPKPARASVISQSSLTSSVDAQDDKDRWWKNVQPLTHKHQQQQQHSMALPPQYQGRRSTDVPQSPTRTRSITYRQPAPGPRLDTAGISDGFQNLSMSVGSESSARRTRTQPSTPAATTPYVEKDFLFNPSEDADTFIKKAKAKAKLLGRK